MPLGKKAVGLNPGITPQSKDMPVSSSGDSNLAVGVDCLSLSVLTLQKISNLSRCVLPFAQGHLYLSPKCASELHKQRRMDGWSESDEG